MHEVNFSLISDLSASLNHNAYILYCIVAISPETIDYCSSEKAEKLITDQFLLYHFPVNTNLGRFKIRYWLVASYPICQIYFVRKNHNALLMPARSACQSTLCNCTSSSVRVKMFQLLRGFPVPFPSFTLTLKGNSSMVFSRQSKLLSLHFTHYH